MCQMPHKGKDFSKQVINQSFENRKTRETKERKKNLPNFDLLQNDNLNEHHDKKKIQNMLKEKIEPLKKECILCAFLLEGGKRLHQIPS